MEKLNKGDYSANNRLFRMREKLSKYIYRSMPGVPLLINSKLRKEQPEKVRELNDCIEEMYRALRKIKDSDDMNNERSDSLSLLTFLTSWSISIKTSQFYSLTKNHWPISSQKDKLYGSGKLRIPGAAHVSMSKDYDLNNNWASRTLWLYSVLGFRIKMKKPDNVEFADDVNVAGGRDYVGQQTMIDNSEIDYQKFWDSIDLVQYNGKPYSRDYPVIKPMVKIFIKFINLFQEKVFNFDGEINIPNLMRIMEESREESQLDLALRMHVRDKKDKPYILHRDSYDPLLEPARQEYERKTGKKAPM